MGPLRLVMAWWLVAEVASLVVVVRRPVFHLTRCNSNSVDNTLVVPCSMFFHVPIYIILDLRTGQFREFEPTE